MKGIVIMGLLVNLLAGIGCSRSDEKTEWGVATGEDGGFPMIARYRMTPPSSICTADFNKLFTITWKYASQNQKRMPETADVEKMNQFEDLLAKGLEAKGIGYMTVVVTHNCVREYQWYGKDSDHFMKVLNRSLSGQKPFPIEISISNDPGWNTYQEFTKALRK